MGTQVLTKPIAVVAAPSAVRPAVNPWLIAITVTLATFMELLDTSIANVSLPHIAGGLAVSYDESTWVLTSYLVANAVVLPLSAWLSRVFGRKNYYMTCVALFVGSSFLCGIAPSLGALLFFRILQGIGGGGLAPVEQAILVDTFPGERLLKKHEISQSEYDRAATEASIDREAVTAGRAEIAAAEKRVSQAQSRLSERKADLLAAGSAPQQIASSQAKAAAAVSDADRAKALLDTAQLNLGYTRIIAPVSGIVGRKTLEEGQRVQPGQQLLTIIPLDDIWITANFKETQLRKMKPGQPVTVSADASGRDYCGHVDALGGATGSMFSLLPPENATGNYVKVVQRVPVRVLLEAGENADHRLRPGMSVEAKVRLR